MEKTTPKNRFYYPVKKLIHGLFQENLRSVVAICHENERPLQGFASELDSHFYGYLSKQIKKGIITGREGECTLTPLKKGDELFYIYILGAGELIKNKNSTNLSLSLTTLIKNIGSMKIHTIGICENDFQNNEINTIQKSLTQGGNLWVFQ